MIRVGGFTSRIAIRQIQFAPKPTLSISRSLTTTQHNVTCNTPDMLSVNDKSVPSSSASSKFTATSIPQAPFPIFTTVVDFRKWRKEQMKKDKKVGFVPTMGALHEGHLALVKESLRENDETVVSIFVNPAQFAPTEDLSSYPRTMESDIAALNRLSSTMPNHKQISAIFAPTVSEMYPSPDGKPFTQVVSDQIGAFVEVAGLQHKMEGSSRPTFFRGVATVVTKLFHIVQPDQAYFGQKDIQQAILLRRLVSDLLFAHPPSPEALRIMPTTRDPIDGLALSSRNAYLTQKSRSHATILYKALCAGQKAWNENPGDIHATLHAARQEAKQCAIEADKDGIDLDILYIDLNDPVDLNNLENRRGKSILDPQTIRQRGAILSGAALIKEGHNGRVTRLIDNFLLGFKL